MAHEEEATVTLKHPRHGTFTVSAADLQSALDAVGSAVLFHVQQQSAGACGHPANGITGLYDGHDDLNKIEAIIAWVESGNHPF